MKKSIIKEIYLNNEGLGEQVVLNKKYKKASDKAYKFYEQLMDELNDEQKKIFEDFTDSEMDASAERVFTLQSRIKSRFAFSCGVFNII